MKKLQLGTSYGTPFWLPLLLLPLLQSLSVVAHAGTSFVLPDNLKILRAQEPDTTYYFAGSNAPGQIFYADEPVNIKLVMTKGKDSGAVNDFGIEIQEVTTRDPNAHSTGMEGFTDTGGHATLFTPEDKPVQAPLKVLFTDAAEIHVDVPNIPVPKKYGTYALILTRGQGAIQHRQFLATVARVPRPAAGGTIENTPIFGEGQMMDNPELSETRARQYQRMGIHGWRSELSWNETKDGTTDWTTYDKLFSAAKAADCRIMVTLGGAQPQWRPFGDPTPAAGWTPEGGGYWGTGDWVASPDNYPRYGKWIETFTRRYWDNGKGGLWGFENYNEPWEGGGISGWARDMLSFRDLQKTIAVNSKKVDPKVQAIAACSIMNTEDKLYPDGTNAMDPYVDVFTDHYVVPSMCYGPMVAAAHGKASMETETWFVNSEYLLPQGVAQFLGAGQRAIAPWHPRVLFDSLPGTANEYFIPSPVVVATAAFNHFVTGKRFNKMVFPNHLPFVFQYGEDNDKDALLVLFGQLLPIGSDNPKEVLWAQVNNASGGTITIDNKDKLLQFFDPAGNPAFVGQASVKLPLTVAATYIKCSRGPAAAAARLKTARIEGKRPVEIMPRDFNAPLGANSTLTVAVHNCLNRAVTGTLAAKPSETVALRGPAQQQVTIAAGESKTLAFPCNPNPAAATEAGANSFPFSFTWTSDAGTAEYSENMNVSIARRGAKTIDGNLDDWKDVPGVTVINSTEKIDSTELLRRPWLAMSQAQPKATIGEVKLAWDDDNLYVAARVNDPTPEPNAIRMATRDDDAFFHTAADDNVSPYKEFIEAFRTKTGDPKRSFGEVPYVYKRSPEAGLPFRRDRIQIAFDVTPSWHDLKPITNVPSGFHVVPDTDYEYSLYWVKDGQDGSSELWRQLAPGVPRIHDFPRQPRGERTTGPVPGSKHIVRRDGDTYIYEASIPKTELADLKLTAGTTFGFTFKIGNSEGANAEYGHDKAVTKINGLTLHPYWERSPSAATRWTLTD